MKVIIYLKMFLFFFINLEKGNETYVFISVCKYAA